MSYINRIIIGWCVCLFLLPVSAIAQERRVFMPGEVLTYDMYFKLGMINARAGTTWLKVERGVYGEVPVLELMLYAKSSGAVKSFYPVADTLFSRMSYDLLPLSFDKAAHEGKDYSIEHTDYHYSGHEIRIHTSRLRNHKLRFDTTLVAQEPVYDMLSILYHVRTLDYQELKRTGKVSVLYLSGRQIGKMDVEYRGMESVKANDGLKYNCLKLILSVNDDAFENKEETMRVYITDDMNRVPVRVETQLKRGSIRTILKEYTGLSSNSL